MAIHINKQLLTLSAAVTIAACSNMSQQQAEHAKAGNLSNFTENPRSAAFQENIFGREINDPYRWMEQQKNQSEVYSWMKASGAHTSQQLDQLPGRQRLVDNLTKTFQGTDQFSGLKQFDNRLFFWKRAAGENNQKLILKENGQERVLLDPGKFSDDADKPVNINSYTISPNGQLIAFHLDSGGSEIGEIRFMEIASGKLLENKITPVWSEFPARWLDDNTLVGTEMTYAIANDPIQGMQAYRYHLKQNRKEILLGMGIENSPEFSPQDFPGIMVLDKESDWLIGYGSGARSSFKIFNQKRSAGNNQWNELADFNDNMADIAQAKNRLFLLSRKDTPKGQVIALDLSDKVQLSDAKVIIPESDKSITRIRISKDVLYFTTQENGFDSLWYQKLNSNSPQQIQLPNPGVISNLHANEVGVTFSVSSPLRNTQYLQASLETVRELGIAADSYPDANKFEVVRELAPSADGVKVPMTIIQARNLNKDGNNPVFINAYGAYGFTIKPVYRNSNFAWLEEGGVMATCHIRGGGINGHEWYLAGKGANKPTGHNDLIACNEHLVKLGYTRPEKITVRGVSAGGALVGPAVLKRPDLFRSAILEVATLNPTRLAFQQNGLNQVAEFGDPRTKTGFEETFAMDAYEWLPRAQGYPDLFLVAGLNDGRVAPWIMAKFAARASSLSNNLVMLRTDAGSGHFATNIDKSVSKYADQYAYALNRAGHEDFQPVAN